MKCFLASILLCAIVASASTVEEKKCGENEYFARQGPMAHCEICGVKFCKLRLEVNVCVCKAGFARSPDNRERGQGCIPIAQCPSRKCGENEYFAESAGSPSCEKCGMRQCTMELWHNTCVCKDGFRRLLGVERGEGCVPIEKCPKRPW